MSELETFAFDIDGGMVRDPEGGYYEKGVVDEKIAELEADLNSYAVAILTACSGIVCTPERGYVADGGVQEAERNLKELRAWAVDWRRGAEDLQDRIQEMEDPCD